MQSFAFISSTILSAFVVFYFIRFLKDRVRGFDNPTSMNRQHLVSAIAGQAEWIEKMRAAPWETQQMSHIIKQTHNRKSYIARLCVEVISRDGEDGQIFYETAQRAKELELSGIGKENAAMSAVKEILFNKNGVFYPSSWEM